MVRQGLSHSRRLEEPPWKACHTTLAPPRPPHHLSPNSWHTLQPALETSPLGVHGTRSPQATQWGLGTQSPKPTSTQGSVVHPHGTSVPQFPHLYQVRGKGGQQTVHKETLGHACPLNLPPHLQGVLGNHLPAQTQER